MSGASGEARSESESLTGLKKIRREAAVEAVRLPLEISSSFDRGCGRERSGAYWQAAPRNDVKNAKSPASMAPVSL